MKDPFVVLREELVDAAGRVAFPEPRRGRRRLSRRPRWSRRALLNALAGTVAVAAALGVALVVLLAGGHRSSSLTAVGRSPIPATARPLVRILGVLRRPQTAADRAVESKVRRADPVLSLVRLAAVTPWGQQLVLVPQKARHHDTLALLVSGGLAPGSSPQAIAGYGGVTGITPAAVEAGEGALSLVPASGSAHASDKTSLFMVVPDGVAKVSFVVPPKRASGSVSGWAAYAPLKSPSVTVPVHNNVAYVQLHQFCCGGVPATRWYASDGRLIKVTGTSPTASGGTVLDVLRADGIGSARFGSSPRAVRAVIDSLLAQAGLAYKPAGAGCGVDHSIVWWDDRTTNRLPNLVAYFGRSRFVGYQYGEYGTMIRPHPPLRGTALATARGLRIGDTLARGRALYGHAFTLSSAQGGTWSVRVGGRLIDGYAWGTPKHGDVSWHSVVATIDAGDVGCAALSP